MTRHTGAGAAYVSTRTPWGPSASASVSLQRSEGELLDDLVRRVHQREARGQSGAGLVVLDVAGDEHVGHGGHAAGDGLGAGAG